ncbi:MAG: FGGY-family carbohydrate kinase [Thiotrichales bacterium]|nr:FGGY-family carbohydrate kinase [Thiotrichales bacterium]
MTKRTQPPITDTQAPLNIFILGVDIGTSGVRGCIVEVNKQVLSNQILAETVHVECSVSMPHPTQSHQTNASSQSPKVWEKAFEKLFSQLAESEHFKQVQHIVADATSSSVLLVDSKGTPLTDALMYNDQQAQKHAQTIQQYVDIGGYKTAATGASSTLAKVLFLTESVKRTQLHTNSVVICHQLDWFNFWLTGLLGITDENNALKLGYDSVSEQWPNWVEACLTQKSAGLPISLPNVVKPGSRIAELSICFANHWGLSTNVSVHAGTTDSIAGFLASGANQSGDAVTSLGSTLALKLVSEKPIFNSAFGIYSHRLGQNWLVGGASNSGGAVLLHYFDLDELKQRLTDLNQPENQPLWQNKSNPNYYPLIKTGERFPIADAAFKSRIPALSQRPKHSEKQALLIAIMQGLANIEQMGYERLEELEASPVKRLFSVGGGTQNTVWQQLRKAYIPVEFVEPDSLNAAFGVTRLVSLFYQPISSKDDSFNR